ncbi:MAG: NADP-dependent oxidoreductase [Alphaproteobacteria bacterium]|nr:NADP-dependent oxidoreductase [Alphaproteobacteria bacterium]
MNDTIHRRWVLAAHPQGAPKTSDFRLEEGLLPVPGPGEFLVRTILIGIEPRLRLMLNPTTETNKAMRPEGAASGLGKLVPSSVLGVVMASNDPDFAPGDLVDGLLGWQSHAVVARSGYNRKNNPAGIRKCDLALGPPAAHLSVLGTPGLTAILALKHEGRLGPGETMVVTSAAGTVGSVAGQLGRLAGARVVGITGSDEKAHYLADELGFDATINYRTAGDLAAAVRAACPNGVDYHFDNVGGAMAATINAQFNAGARHTRCGIVSKYNLSHTQWHQSDEFDGQFTVHDHVAEYTEAKAELARLLKADDIKCVERIFDGIESAPAAFVGLMQGENIGKWLVRVSEDPQ